MNIVVLAGGLSTERDVSLTTGSMVSRALRERGHCVIMLDVYLGYEGEYCDIADVFSHSEEVGVTAGAISAEAPDLAQVKAMRGSSPDGFFGPNVIRICQAADFVFMALHGENGEDGRIQAAFDLF
ncbi:MAG: D-alanine--D-alanine ligase, partial [Clostridiales bacterium]|nr:D-alanine--D-alanine ligase [Clostridiales bacterium]